LKKNGFMVLISLPKKKKPQGHKMSIAKNNENVTPMFLGYEKEIEQWHTEQIYARLIARHRAHLLVRVGVEVDFGPMEKACAGYRLYAGKRGQEASYSLGQLGRMLLVKYLYGWSLRQTEIELSTDLLLRWFCGYNLSEKVADHVTLGRFEAWMVANQPRTYFDLVLQRIDQDFPDGRKATQIGDTFGMESHTADLRLYDLLGRMAEKVWDAYLRLLPAHIPPDPEAERLYDLALHPDPAPPVMLAPQEWEAWTLRRAQQVASLPSRLERAVKLIENLDPARLADFHEWRARLQKVLADECVLTVDDEGQPSVDRLRQAKERGSYRLLTPVDPDITLRVHDDDVIRGYNVSVAATTDFVREIAAATGSTPDSVGVDKLIEAQRKHLGVVPPKFVYDQAAGTAKKIADVAKASDNQTQLVVRLVDYHRNRARFGPLDFSLDERGVLTCPNGQTSSKAYRSNSADGWTYRFVAAQCEGCPLTQRCRGDAVKSSSYRQVFISSYHYQYRTAIAYMKTEEFKTDMALRPHIERIIACLVRYNHARTTRKAGLHNADFQVKMAAVAYNLKHWLVLIRQREKQQVRSHSP
jgi:hypothetical protein